MTGYLLDWLAMGPDRRGVTALEYGLIAGAVVAVIAATLFTMGTSIETTYQSVAANL